MPPWLQQTWNLGSPVEWSTLCVRLGLAVLFGLYAAGVYRLMRPQSADNRTFPGTLLLLCVLIAMVTQVIGDNVARAFSLVGALSIVRFRTVVQDTQDTAFVIFAVAVGMAVGAGQPAVALIGCVAVTLAAGLLKDRNPASNSPSDTDFFDLEVRLGWSREAEVQLKQVLAQHAISCFAQGASTVRQGSAINLSYRLQLPEKLDLSLLIAELNRVESVQSVDLKRAN